MNKIQKTYPAPEILTAKGATLTASTIEQAESGKDKLTFDYGTFGHASVS